MDNLWTFAKRTQKSNEKQSMQESQNKSYHFIIGNYDCMMVRSFALLPPSVCIFSFFPFF